MSRAMGAISLSLLILSCGACTQSVAEAGRSDTCLILRSAERFMAVHYTKYPTLDQDPVVEDQGRVWMVTYVHHYPKNPDPHGDVVIGLEPVLYVDKQTLQVVRDELSQ